MENLASQTVRLHRDEITASTNPLLTESEISYGTLKKRISATIDNPREGLGEARVRGESASCDQAQQVDINRVVDAPVNASSASADYFPVNQRTGSLPQAVRLRQYSINQPSLSQKVPENLRPAYTSTIKNIVEVEMGSEDEEDENKRNSLDKDIFDIEPGAFTTYAQSTAPALQRSGSSASSVRSSLRKVKEKVPKGARFTGEVAHISSSIPAYASSSGIFRALDDVESARPKMGTSKAAKRQPSPSHTSHGKLGKRDPLQHSLEHGIGILTESGTFTESTDDRSEEESFPLWFVGSPGHVHWRTSNYSVMVLYINIALIIVCGVLGLLGIFILFRYMATNPSSETLKGDMIDLT